MEKKKLDNKGLKEVLSNKSVVTHDDALKYAHKNNLTLTQAKVILNRDYK